MYTGNLKYLYYPGITITIVSSKSFFAEWNVWEQLPLSLVKGFFVEWNVWEQYLEN